MVCRPSTTLSSSISLLSGPYGVNTGSCEMPWALYDVYHILSEGKKSDVNFKERIPYRGFDGKMADREIDEGEGRGGERNICLICRNEVFKSPEDNQEAELRGRKTGSSTNWLYSPADLAWSLVSTSAFAYLYIFVTFKYEAGGFQMAQ